MFDVEKIREEFPILGREVYGRPLVYLDSGATAQKPRCVIDCIDRLHREQNANIHRGVHHLSAEATTMYEACILYTSPSPRETREDIKTYSG